MDIKPLFGLCGVLIAAITSEFNDQVTSIALSDVRGALGISHDAGTWIESLYVSAEIIGMAISPWLLATFTLRRWTLFAIALCGVSSVLIPFSPNIEAIYTLRLLQGLAGGMIIPLLMTTAFRVLTPDIRLYGLAVYALTATFTPALASTVAAFWTDIVDWRFVFVQTIPLCSLAGVLVWYCPHQDQPKYERFRMLDWRGALLLVIGTGALSTMLYQGDRLDWFNSSLICVLALVSAVAIPLFLVNEWFHPLPFLKLQMLGRRNIAYGAVGLFTFLLISQSGSAVPLRYLQEVQGYRPLQSNLITLEIAASQLVMLPAMALLLDYKRVDSRVVSLVGLGLILASCVGSSFLTVYWNRDQFCFDYACSRSSCNSWSTVFILLFILSTTLSFKPTRLSISFAAVSFIESPNFFKESVSLSRVSVPLSGANNIPNAAPAAIPTSNATTTFELSFIIL